jgi:hypothetical protein
MQRRRISAVALRVRTLEGERRSTQCVCVLLPEMERIVTAGDALRDFLPQWMKKGVG